MIPAIAIIGHHDSGKTRMIEELLRRLAERGLRVGTVKHAPHLTTLDDRDADSARHREAGAHRTLLRGATSSALFFGRGALDDLRSDLERFFPDCDLVLIEGDKHGPWTKIEIFRRGRDVARDPLAGEIDVAAVVTDDRVALPDGALRFGTRDGEALADFVEELARGKRPNCPDAASPLR
ncbi:MAG: molybdopterin-guanine dinucleotide biosynthesis protein B [Candidatus Bipolaricaulota bacterium]